MEKFAGCHSIEECGGSATRRTYDHELSHMRQSYELGFGYVPVNIFGATSAHLSSSNPEKPPDRKICDPLTGAGHLE
jgi:hypothetical protein